MGERAVRERSERGERGMREGWREGWRDDSGVAQHAASQPNCDAAGQPPSFLRYVRRGVNRLKECYHRLFSFCLGVGRCDGQLVRRSLSITQIVVALLSFRCTKGRRCAELRSSRAGACMVANGVSVNQYYRPPTIRGFVTGRGHTVVLTS